MLTHSRITSALLTAGLISFATTAHENITTRAITHAPIGVMGDHMHKQGEMMVSYRIMNMKMSGNLQGTQSICQPTHVASHGESCSPRYDQPNAYVWLYVCPHKQHHLDGNAQLLKQRYEPYHLSRRDGD